MGKVSYCIRLNQPIQTLFSKKCKDNGLNVSEVMEAIMQAYIDDKISIESKISITMKEEMGEGNR